MNYPFWDTGIGYGILMAAISVLHVFISHFAIGGGLYLVVAEAAARKQNHLAKLKYLERLSRFFILVTVVLGALTGVGIWFVIGLLNPAGTEVLIHNFVWGWAVEWTFFAVEICAAILYYYGWKTLSARSHLRIGWIYFAAAWLSLVIINGILTFMLTPGEWLKTGDFWDGFLNPTYWPSLVMRSGVCVMLGGLYAMLIAARIDNEILKSEIVRYNANWSFLGLIITLPSFYWYWKAIPADILNPAVQQISILMPAISKTYFFAAAIAILVVLFGFLLPKRMSRLTAVVILLCGLGWFGSFEWFREAARKPYVITGYMYANAMELANIPEYKKTGYLPHIAYKTGHEGADLFRHACRTCHTLDGYRPLKPALDGTDKAFIAGMIKGLHKIKGNMPPFVGTDAEIQSLAATLHQQSDSRPIEQIYGLQGVELGRKVYEIRCGRCHEFGGHNDKSDSLVGLTEKDYGELLDMSGNMTEEMPGFSGSDSERKALIQYLMTVKKPGGAQ